jgi:AraC family transcriptional regulator
MIATTPLNETGEAVGSVASGAELSEFPQAPMTQGNLGLGAMNNCSLHAGSYYGGIDARIESSCGLLSQVVHSSGCCLPMHAHVQAYFSLLLAGDYLESSGGSEWRYQPFDAGYHPAQLPHRDSIGAAGARFICLEVSAAALDAAEVRIVDFTLLPADIAVQLLRLYRPLTVGTLAAIDCENAVWELCDGISGGAHFAERGQPGWLRRSLELIEEEFGEPLTVQDIARRSGIHPVHLSREFRRRFGESLGEYTNKVRVRRACALMTRDTGPLAAVAAATGFADQSHFCRVFKSLLRCTPSEFRGCTRSRVR